MKKLLFILFICPIYSLAQKEVEGNYFNIIASGGVPPYSYSIDSINFQANDTFKCLLPGKYKYYTRDFYNTTISSPIVIYAPLSAIASSIGRTSITIFGVDGKAPYSYKLSTNTTYKTSGTFNNLQRRKTYTFNVKDALGFVVTISATTI